MDVPRVDRIDFVTDTGVLLLHGSGAGFLNKKEPPRHRPRDCDGKDHSHDEGIPQDEC